MTRKRNDITKIFRWYKAAEDIYMIGDHLRLFHGIWWSGSPRVRMGDNNRTVFIEDGEKRVMFKANSYLDRFTFFIEYINVPQSTITIEEDIVMEEDGELWVCDPTTKSSDHALWLRDQKRIDSLKGYRGINLDFNWHIVKDGEITNMMLIEEKTNTKPSDVGILTGPQRKIFELEDKIHKESSYTKDIYYGFHLVEFERTTPKNGAMYIDGKHVNLETYFKFLEFALDKSFYVSLFNKETMNSLDYNKKRSATI